MWQIFILSSAAASTTAAALSHRVSGLIKGIDRHIAASSEIISDGIQLKSGHTFNLTAAIPDSLSVKYKIICTTKANGNNVGGAVGRACKSVIKGITVKSTITNKAESGKYTGGVVGFFDNGNKSVEHCAFLGILTGKEYTGGIVGEINKLGQIKQCVNYGNINGANRTGGIVGKVNYVDDEPWVNECVNVGPVTASHFVGGIAGYISADGNEGKDWIKVARCVNI